MNLGVVITGILIEDDIDELISVYKNIKYKIISTWNDQDIILVNKLKDENFIIVQDDYPLYMYSTNYQMKSSYNGCIKAKELGCDYVIKIRGDIICNNFDLFINVLKDKYFDSDKLISFAGMDFGNAHVCIMDNMIAGNINNMIKLYTNIIEPNNTTCPEIYLQENYIKKNNLTKEDIRNNFIFCFNHCRDNNLTFFIKKHYKWEFIRWRCVQDDVWF